MILTLKFSKTNPQLNIHYTAPCSGLKQELNQILKQCRGQSSFLKAPHYISTTNVTRWPKVSEVVFSTKYTHRAFFSQETVLII